MLAAALLAAACAKVPEAEPSVEGMQSVILNLLPSDVRTTLDAGRSHIVWTDGDAISVFNDSDASVARAIYPSSLIVSIPEAATALKAVYPETSGSFEEPGISFPKAQTQAAAGTLNGKYYPIVAEAQISGGRADLAFEAAGSAFALNVFNPTVSGEKLVSVSVQPSGMTEPVVVTLDTPYALSSGTPAVKRSFEGQVYVCFEKGKYSSVVFKVTTTAGSYTITSNSTEINCFDYDFQLLNLDLSHCSVTITLPGLGVEEFEIDEEGKTVDITSSLENPVFDPSEAAFADPTRAEDLDFSRVGYHYGDTPIPDYPVSTTITVADVEAAVLSGSATDAADVINNAIAAAPGGTAVLLKEGTYHIGSTISFSRDRVVLRGEGAEKTLIIAEYNPSNPTYSCVLFGLDPKSSIDLSSLTEVADAHVPAGAMYVNVRDASHFNIGDNVRLYRRATPAWISAIRMDCIDDPVNPSWDPAEFNIDYERRVTAVSGSRVYFDNPVAMDIDGIYGGGFLMKCSTPRISECGLENLTLQSTYDPSVVCTAEIDESSFKHYGAYPCDENHSRNGVLVRAAEHCWIKGVSGRHFFFATVSLQKGARFITVEDCHSFEPVSIITGSRRYAFAIGLAEACIVKDCTADKDRHMFVTPSRSNGPNVFLRCTGTNCYSVAGPHCYWATFILYDNVSVDDEFNVNDTGGEAELSSHGWTGVNHVLWNCTAPLFAVQSPWATGKNYACGCVGKKRWGHYFNVDPRGKDPQSWIPTDKWRPDGEWTPPIAGGETNTVRMAVESLYESQLEARHAAGIYLYR